MSRRVRRSAPSRGVLAAALAAAIAGGAVGGPAAVAQAPAEPELECLIQPRETVSIAMPVSGIIERVAVDRGDRVTRGMVLVALESASERAAVGVARARTEQQSALRSGQTRVEFGTRRFERTDEMYRKDLVPLKELDEAETAKILADHALLEAQENLQVARLELERAEAALALRTVRSPIDGVVVERLQSPGEFAMAEKTAVLKLARLDPLRVEVFAPVALFGRLQVGRRAVVVPEAPLGASREAVVTVVDRVVDAASGTFGVRLELPNPDYRLPAGLKCRVRFLR
jgi:RND family efflux transporter MFP subunit